MVCKSLFLFGRERYNYGMHNTIRFEETIHHNNLLYVDLRTASEYENAHIPDAVSLPVLSDAEYQEVGTEYTHGSRETAKEIAVRYASQRLPMLYTTIANWVSAYEKVVLYCYRGGFRSSVLFQLLLSLGIGVYKLSGGYKAYRKFVNASWESALTGLDWITLYGNTGTGKTELLHALRDLGQPVLDLEGIANHRGSLLGGVGLQAQPSQKMFESILQKELLLLPKGPVFIEGESRKIGDLFIPAPLFDALIHAPRVYVEAPMEQRIARLKEEYTQVPQNELLEAVRNLTAFIGIDKTDEICRQIRHGETEPAIERLLTRYYDVKYNYRKKTFQAKLLHINTKAASRLLMEAAPGLLRETLPADPSDIPFL